MASNEWDSIGTPVSSSEDWSAVGTPVGDPKKKQNKGIMADIGTDIKRGIMSIPGAITGLADIPISAVTGGAYANKAADAIGDITGFQPSKWSEEAKDEYSPERNAASQAIEKALEDNESPFSKAADGDWSGLKEVTKAYVQNPRHTLGQVVESVPSMLAGGLAGRGIAAVSKLAPRVGGAIGEGAMIAGQQMDQLSDTDADPRMAAAASLATGAGGTLLGIGGGKLAQAIGVVDPETALAGGAARGIAGEAVDKTIKGSIADGAKRVAGGAVSEGLFEELPQSVLEQALSNLAQGKDWSEGVDRAAIEGTLAGSLMGGAFNAMPLKKQEQNNDIPPSEDGPAGDQSPMLALPAPTYTGTPGDQIIASDAERQAAIDKAQAEADALYAARDEFEREQRRGFPGGVPTITNDPAPIQQRIDALLGINQDRLTGIAQTNYEKAIDSAFNERIGFAVGNDGLEIPVTMADYLASKVAVGDIDRNSAIAARLSGNANQAADARLQQIADEEATQQPDITPIAAPSIPVVGPISAAANAAVSMGAASIPSPASGIMSGVVANEQKPQAVVEKATQEAVAAPSEFDVSKRTDKQLDHLTKHGQPGWKEAAVAEIQKRNATVAPKTKEKSEHPTKNSAPVIAQKAADSNKPAIPDDIPNGDGVTNRPEVGELPTNFSQDVQYAKRHDGSYKTKEEYTSDEWAAYTKSAINKKLSTGRDSIPNERTVDGGVVDSNLSSNALDAQSGLPKSSSVVDAPSNLGPNGKSSLDKNLPDGLSGNSDSVSNGGKANAGLVDGVSSVNVPPNGVSTNAPSNPSSGESGLDVSPVGADLKSDLLQSHPGLVKGYGSLDVPSKRAVLALVSRLAKDSKVFDSIVSLVPVDVMNNLLGRESSSKVTLNDKAMFSDALLSVDGESNVVSRVINSLVGSTASSGAEVSSASSVAASSEVNPAVGTDYFHGIGQSNKIFTADKAQAARERLRKKLGTINSGIDPELLVDGMTLAGYYIEGNLRKFGDYAKAMVEDLGEGVKPYLLSFYEAARAYPGMNKMGMDTQEEAAKQHQAILTPEVKAAAKEVIGESPKVEKKKPSNLGEAVRLKADWGVQNIDGYTRSKTGKNQETDYGLKGGIKDEFLADAKRYLRAVSKLLEDQGFTVHLDKKGKGQSAVSANEAGPAVSGDVTLTMRRGDFGVYATVGVSSVRGIGPNHPQGVSLMVRVTPQAETDRYANKGMNNWLSPDLAAGDLAAWFDNQYQAYKQRSAAVDIPAPSATLETGKASNVAPAIGEDNGTAIVQQGNQALEGMAAESVRGTAGGESVDNGSGSGGQGRGAGNEGTDGRRDAQGRSGGNRASEVDSSAAGTGIRGGARAGNRDGRNSGGKNGSLGEDSGEAREGGYVQGNLTTSTIPESNFEITDDVGLGSGGQMTKYRDNVAAIKTLKAIEAERRRATAAEKKVLARYVGWGGIPNAFRNGVTGEIAKDWDKEVAELESLLTPKELRAASASTRNAHYTAKEVVDFMWGVVGKMGFAGGMVLEPSVGTGNFVGLMPKELSGDSFVTGIELDSLTARIAGALYPKSTIVNTGFQKAALPSNRFKLAIGNPPFGSESLRFQYRPELNGASIHNQFFLGSMDALEPSGIMAMVVSRYLMDAQDATTREKLAIDAELAGAIRLPGSAFKGNALTEVVTDILFFRKREIADAEKLREAYFKRGKEPKSTDYKVISEYRQAQHELETALRWTKTTEVADPLGGEPMVVSQYFADRPNTIVGKMERSGSMRQGGDIDVKLEKGEKLADRLNALLEKLPQQTVQTQNEEARINTEKFHKAMGESLRLSAKGAEADAIYFDEDGDLATVVERVGQRGDETALTTIKISPDTPWSTSLSMDLDGHWFREVAKTDKDGKPVKAVDKNGKVLKRNVYERQVFKRESDIPKTMLLGETKYAKMKALISLRDLLVKQIDLEVGRSPIEQMENSRGELREAYEAFVREHGFISDAKNAAIVADMPDEGLLMSLETGYRPEVTEKKAKATGMAPSKASAKPAAILSRPVAIPPAVMDHAETAVDALAIVLSESGAIDIKRIAELRDISEEAAIKELTEGDKPLAFKDPENGDALIEKNAYLSGNVRRKLEAARQAGLDANINALESVQPEPWSSDKVTARIGANWVPAKTYSEFVTHLLGDKGLVQYAKLTNTFMVKADGDTANATSKWGTKRVPAPRLIENILNSSRIAVYDTDSDGNRHFNQTETDAANDKAKEIREEFDNWVFKDADRRAELTKLFNDIFNTRVTPQYDGSHLKFPGKVPDEIISLRRGQRNAVWRGIIDDAVLYDHAVGAGKTFTGIARVMERRRMGMSKKPAIIVPNHMVGEWAAQAYRLYPGAKILAATKKDLVSKNRRRLFAKIASGDWDMVIIPHSSFQFISISPETEERILLEELAIANAALKDAEAEADSGSRFKPLSVKEAEAMIEKIEKRLETARGKLGKDRLLTFEQMGIDDLSIDESHEFKNLFYSSNLTDVRGMGNKQGSNKAFDLYSKTRVVRDAGGSIAFMTGTPISNSAVELYNILRYLAPNTLQESGIEHFDAFRSMYVDATAKFEPTDSGGGLKLVTRLGRSWSNMRSLMELYYSVADVVTNDDIKRWFAEDNPGKEFPLPKVKGGDRQAVSVKATPTQMRLLEETISSFEGLDSIEDVKERNAERLRLMDRARKLSLHAKAVDPRLDDEPGGKLDVVADKAVEIWKKWSGDKGTQLIFLDRGVPKAKGDSKIIKEYDDLSAKLREASLKGDEDAAQKIIDRLESFDANEISELRMAQESNWNGYQHIKDRLVSLGVPANEIAFVQDFDGDAAKEQLFHAVRDGSIRILLGSSPRMGAGTNVQERLVALHHVDATWKPSDIEQREGRIIRQGNALLEKYGNDFEVEILAYVTERTVDAKLWDLNSTKLRMINAIRYYDGQFEMDFDDEAAVGMAEIAAIASGDPLLLERFKLSTEIDNLYRAKRSHRRRVESAEDSLRHANRVVDNAPKEIEESKEDYKLRTGMVKSVSADVESRVMVMDGKEYGHADITKARMDLENFVGGIGEDEKFSITINGKEYTSKGGAEEAIQLSLGDAEPFVAEIGGKKLIRRSDYARALRERIGESIDKSEKVEAFDAGTIGGINVRAEITSSYGGPAIFLGVDGKYESTGRRRSVVGQRYMTPDKHKEGDPIPVTVNGLRPLISDFERTVYMLRDGSNEIANRAERAEADIGSLEEQVKEPFNGEAELGEKIERLAKVEAELSGRNAAKENESDEESGAGNIAAPSSMSPADKAIYGMSAEGKSAPEILKFIASASRSPFNRQVANLLLKTGIYPKVTVGDGKNWKMNAGEGNKYAAGYNPKTNTIALFRPAAAERNVLHEMIHAATLNALEKNGLSSGQMKALYKHVKKTGKLKGMYGMSDIDEFVAEAFTNPKFQDRLKSVSAPAGGNKLATAWDWFVRVVRGILGLKQGQDNALSRALEIGLGVMRENMTAGDAGVPFREVGGASFISADDLSNVDLQALADRLAAGRVRYNVAGKGSTGSATIEVDGVMRPTTNSNGKPIAQTEEGLRNFWRWFGNSRVVDADDRPLVVYHGTDKDFSEFSKDHLVDKRGFFFAKDRQGISAYANKSGGFVIPAYLKIENPISYEQKQALSKAAMQNGANQKDVSRIVWSEIREKYDGEDVSGVWYVAFHPHQIKSATGNNGDFDGVNPDIRYNVADEGWQVSEPSKMDDVIYALQDKQIDLKRVMQSIMATGKKVRDNFNAYLQEELFHGRAAKGVKDFLDFELRPLLSEMQKSGVEMGDFEEYLWNRHAEERNKQIAKINPDMPDGGSGINTADAKAYLSGLSKDQKAKFDALAKRIDAINRNSQGILVSSGLETQETINAWNGAYQHYVPLQREDVDSGHVGTGKGFSVRGSATKRAMGSGKKVVDIIANITMQRERNIVRAEKNRVSNALLGLAMENPNPDFWKVDQAPKERVVNNVAVYTVRDADGNVIGETTRLDDAERVARSTAGSSIDQEWKDRVQERIVPGFQGRDNVLHTRVNGKDHYIEFNERDDRAMRMAMAMKNLDVDNMGRVLSVVGKATRYLASVNTQYNPVFGVINLIRDFQGALINVQSTAIAGEQKRVAGYTVDALRGIYADIRAHRRGDNPSSNWAKLFEEFQKEGGKTGYRDQYANAESRAEAIRDEIKQFGEGKPMRLARGIFGWLSDYNEAMENAVRLSAYKVAKEKGLSNQQAASLAKNITVNFNRKGQVASQVGALYAFFNASVQGTARIAETMFDNNSGKVSLSKLGKKVLAGGIMLGSMQAMLLAAAGYDDDEPPEFVRERSLIIPIGDGKYVSIPMPLGFHVIPGIGRIATEFAMSGFKDPAKRTVAMLGMFSESFNPIGSSGFSIQTLTPSVVDPFAALAENRDFTGREIYRENFNANDPSPGHTRAKDVATAWSRYISEGINWISGGTEFKPGVFSPSPDAIDYLIAQAGGGVMREANKIVQTLQSGVTGEDLPLYKIPLVGRFVGDTEGQSGQSQRFYNAVREINMHEREVNGLREAKRFDDARAYVADNPVIRMAMQANRIETMVRKMRDARRNAVESGDPEKVREINDRISAMMQQFNERSAPLLE